MLSMTSGLPMISLTFVLKRLLMETSWSGKGAKVGRGVGASSSSSSPPSARFTGGATN